MIHFIGNFALFQWSGIKPAIFLRHACIRHTKKQENVIYTQKKNKNTERDAGIINTMELSDTDVKELHVQVFKGKQ